MCWKSHITCPYVEIDDNNRLIFGGLVKVMAFNLKIKHSKNFPVEGSSLLGEKE